MSELLYPPCDGSSVTDLQAVELNYASQGLLFGGWLQGVTSYHEEHDNLRYTTGLDSMYLNGVSWSSFSADRVRQRVAEIGEHLLEHASAASWSVLGSQPNRHILERELESNGWSLLFEACAMSRATSNVERPEGPFAIARVTSPLMMREWLPPFMEGFAFPPECERLLNAAYGKAATERDFHYRNYVLYERGEAICSGSLQTVNGCAVIYNIATVSSARRRGAASAMIGFLQREASLQGFKRVSLFALPAAASLYEKLEFRRDNSTALLYGRTR